MTETLTIDRPRPGVVVLQLNRPQQLNAINAFKEAMATLPQAIWDLASSGRASPPTGC